MHDESHSSVLQVDNVGAASARMRTAKAVVTSGQCRRIFLDLKKKPIF